MHKDQNFGNTWFDENIEKQEAPSFVEVTVNYKSAYSLTQPVYVQEFITYTHLSMCEIVYMDIHCIVWNSKRFKQSKISTKRGLRK